jgi:hypothetical protein
MDPRRYERFALCTRTRWDALLARPELLLDAERRAARRQAREYARQGRPPADGSTANAWEAKPIEMDLKPIEMEMKPIEMEILQGL